MKEDLNSVNTYRAEWDAVIEAWKAEEALVLEKYGKLDEDKGRRCSRELRPIDKKYKAQLKEIQKKYFPENVDHA